MNRQNTESFINILLAEDNPADVRLLEEALFENDINIHLFSVPNGVEAVSFLFWILICRKEMVWKF